MKGQRAMLGVLAVLALSLGSACRNTAEGVKEDTRENAAKAQEEAQQAKDASKDTAEKVGEKVEAAGDKIAEGAKDVGQVVKEGAKDVGQAVKEGAQEVATEVDAKKQTLDVKTALMADRSIDASNIDVDTDAATKTVTLKGSVPTAEQRSAAMKVARDHAAGYRVRSELLVAGERSSRPPS